MTQLPRRDALKIFITGFLSDPTHDEQSLNSMTADVFRIALSALDAESVAWRVGERLFNTLAAAGQYASEMRMTAQTLYTTSQPAVSNIDDLSRIVTGMSVSVDVSTSELDAGNRYFGKVTEVSELNSAKHGVILLVQDVEANFKLSNNPPAIPDGWIPCRERMPDRDIDVQLYCSDKNEQMVGYMERNECEGWFKYASLPITNGGGVYCKPTHWRPLPAPPQ